MQNHILINKHIVPTKYTHFYKNRSSKLTHHRGEMPLNYIADSVEKRKLRNDRRRS